MKPEIKNAAMLGGYTMGMIAHIMMGVTIFPVAYDVLPGSPLIKGLSFGAVLWIAAVVMVMPMAGAGFMMSNIGGIMAVMAALMGHLVYGGLAAKAKRTPPKTERAPPSAPSPMQNSAFLPRAEKFSPMPATAPPSFRQFQTPAHGLSRCNHTPYQHINWSILLG